MILHFYLSFQISLFMIFSINFIYIILFHTYLRLLFKQLHHQVCSCFFFDFIDHCLIFKHKCFLLFPNVYNWALYIIAFNNCFWFLYFLLPLSTNTSLVWRPCIISFILFHYCFGNTSLIWRPCFIWLIFIDAFHYCFGNTSLVWRPCIISFIWIVSSMCSIIVLGTHL
jgi:hypothetical protein